MLLLFVSPNMKSVLRRATDRVGAFDDDDADDDDDDGIDAESSTIAIVVVVVVIVVSEFVLLVGRKNALCDLLPLEAAALSPLPLAEKMEEVLEDGEERRSSEVRRRDGLVDTSTGTVPGDRVVRKEREESGDL